MSKSEKTILGQILKGSKKKETSTTSDDVMKNAEIKNRSKKEILKVIDKPKENGRVTDTTLGDGAAIINNAEGDELTIVNESEEKYVVTNNDAYGISYKTWDGKDPEGGYGSTSDKDKAYVFTSREAAEKCAQVCSTLVDCKVVQLNEATNRNRFQSKKYDYEIEDLTKKEDIANTDVQPPIEVDIDINSILKGLDGKLDEKEYRHILNILTTRSSKTDFKESALIEYSLYNKSYVMSLIVEKEEDQYKVSLNSSYNKPIYSKENVTLETLAEAVLFPFEAIALRDRSLRESENKTAPTSVVAKALQDIWNQTEFELQNDAEYMAYFHEKFGWELDDATFKNAWELASEEDIEDETDVLVIDGEEYHDKLDARKWLNSKISQYGNTAHFSDDDTATLNELIAKFGNTYFWK